MSFRIGPWVLALLLAIICAGAIGGVWYVRSVAKPSAASMQERLPTDVHAVVGIDFSALRKGGMMNRLLPEATSIEEQDYRNFVSLTGFDYRSDLDYVLLGFKDDARFVLANGHFDWAAIMKYAELNEGSCKFGFCRMGSSVNGRHISYFAQRNNVIALGIGPDEWSANALEEKYEWQQAELAPEAPAWVLLRQKIFQDPGNLPEPYRPWLQLLNGATRASIALFPAGGGFEIRMQLACSGAGTALRIHERLTNATRELSDAMIRDDQPVDGKTVPAVLASGKFTVDKSQINGIWTVDQDLIDLLFGGNL